jgi:peptide/nickel transport system substrate-binding protein
VVIFDPVVTPSWQTRDYGPRGVTATNDRTVTIRLKKPFPLLPNAPVAGARLVFERFQDYVPRKGGTPQLTSGPKIANFDRIE